MLRVATRGTPLARAQTDLVIDALQRVHPQLHCEPVVVRTTGDADPTRPIAALGERGVFTKALQDALLDGRADVAVHSFKDLPTESVPGLTIAAVPARGDPREALVAGPVCSLADLPPGALNIVPPSDHSHPTPVWTWSPSPARPPRAVA